MNEGLKPCPFCGAKTKLSEVIVFPNGEKSPAYIKCRICGYHFHDYENDKVVIAWNTRPAEDTLRARADKAEGDLCKAKTLLEDACDELYNSGMSPALLARVVKFLWPTGCTDGER